MATGRESYKFGRKNNWRRQIWNEAKERLVSGGKAISDCTVLYLPGGENLDHQVAISKGFKPWNLYAVENNEDKAKELRNKKVNVIVGDFNDVLNAWPIKEKIDFMFADFCCGITNTAYRFSLNLILCQSMSEKCVVAVNLLRGRDAQFRDAYSDILKDLDKHRGKQFYRILVSTMMLFQYQDWCEKNTNAPPSVDVTSFVNSITSKYALPTSYSYKSLCGGATLYMDSVIFNWGTMINFADTGQKAFRAESTPNTGIPSLGVSFDFNHDFKNIKNKVIAAKAIHTMRRNGQLSTFV